MHEALTRTPGTRPARPRADASGHDVGSAQPGAASPGPGAPEGGRVLVYRSSLLPVSETFVLAQVQALRRWRPVLVGRRRVPGLALPESLPIVLPGAAQPPWWRALGRRWARWRGTAPPGEVRCLREQGAQLVHAHFATDGVEVAPLARALGLPLLVTLHGFDIHVRAEHWSSGAGGRSLRDYPARLRALVRDPAVHFVAVSEDVRRAARALGVDEARLKVLPVGIDVARFEPGPRPMAERPPRVLFIGRLVEKKGCAHLLRAMALPPLRALNAELVVVGDGPLRGALEEQAAALGLRARFTGSADAAGVRRELHAARALCLPSVTAANGDAEGFGLVLLEAQACAVPVVSSARGGRDEGMIDGVTGHAVPEADEAALADALAAVVGNPALAQRMGDAGRRFVQQRFDLADCTAALERWYDELAGGRGGVVPPAGIEPASGA